MYRSFISLASNTISRATAFNPVLSQARNIIVNYRPDAQLGETADAATMITQLDNDLLARLKSTDTLKRKVPSTPSKRFWLRLDRSELWKGRPIMALTEAMKNNGGRNNLGRITIRNRGGRVRRRYRKIDFKRSIVDVDGIVQRLEHDPNRSAHIALVRYPDDSLQYIIAPHGIRPGDSIRATRAGQIEIRPGNSMPLKFIPIGTFIHCMEIHPGEGAQVCRAAGAVAQVIEKDRSPKKGFVVVRIASREVRLVNEKCVATIGTVSNLLHHSIVIGKAGRNRWLGRRPVTRGISRNPVDHPHGGGSAAGSCGRPSTSPTAILAKGYKTRRGKKKPAHILVARGGPVEERVGNRKSQRRIEKKAGGAKK